MTCQTQLILHGMIQRGKKRFFNSICNWLINSCCGKKGSLTSFKLKNTVSCPLTIWLTINSATIYMYNFKVFIGLSLCYSQFNYISSSRQLLLGDKFWSVPCEIAETLHKSTLKRLCRLSRTERIKNKIILEMLIRREPC